MLRTVKGIAASDGIGIAKAYTLIEPDLSFEKKTIDDPATEYQRIEAAFDQSISELATIKQNAKSRLSDEELEVFDAHIAILSDPEMKSQIKDEIESQHVSAEEAMTDVTTNFA
ncbi:phosphoenolpyruvate-utilizing N-terminal domain-containing protein, partial [Limosilactobacillus mucosae]